MKFSNPNSDLYIPNGPQDAAAALAKVTHLCIAAHQDDIEIMAHDGITAGIDHAGKAFGGVVVTNGAGSPRTGPYAKLDDAGMQKVRAEEQRAAARLGKYAVQIQLAHPSSEVKKAHSPYVVSDLIQILRACRPEVLYLHNPVDKHDTHIAVLLRCLDALRPLPPAQRPTRVLGCEVWRDLDWMVDSDKVALDCGAHPELASELLKVFDSQVTGGKRYDLAAVGRRLANATFFTSHQTDRMQAITWAMDLTPLLQDEHLTLEQHAAAHIDRLRNDALARIRRFA